jgi:hypothetical protein
MAHFHARHENGCIELDWEVRNADEVRWRVLRSEQGYAASAEPPGANGQVLVNESPGTYLADQGLDPSKHYCYTVFSQEPDGTWRKQVEAKLRPHDRLGWFHPQAHDVVDAEASLAKVPGSSAFTQHDFVGGIEVFSDDGRLAGPWRLHNAAVQDWLTLDGGD